LNIGFPAVIFFPDLLQGLNALLVRARAPISRIAFRIAEANFPNDQRNLAGG
jgi:hypothetical protein